MSDKPSMKDLVREAREAAVPHQNVTAAPQPGSEDYIPPAVSVPLPSRGKVYGPESALFDTETLDVRAMCARDENIMTSPALLRSGRMLTALMKACTISRTIDPEEMLMGDRNALMVAIRNCSYGSDYQVKVRCPHCDTEQDHTFDLSRLSMKTLDVEPVGGAGNNLFSFTLPVTKKAVLFSLYTSRMQRELDDILEGQRKVKGAGSVEENVTQGLAMQISKVGDTTDRRSIHRFVENMPVRDSRAIRAYIDKITPDVDMKQDFECKSCAKKAVLEVPLTAEFFWPQG